jgi:hypothetical protein
MEEGDARRRLATVQRMPSVNLRPPGAGVDIVIRYITRAGVRVETRNRLFAVIVELMQGESKEDRSLAPLSRTKA